MARGFEPMGLQRTRAGLGLGIAALASLAAVVALVLWSAPDAQRRFAVAGLGPMTADEVSRQFFLVAPELLTRVYNAFNETGETAIYDGLAQVAAGDALEALYLERVGAMAGGGLDASDRADQQIHTMEMLRIDTRRDGDSFVWDARWRVVGSVRHATHLHVRGNVYAAILTVAPVDGAWRITDFELTDVDRTGAGQIVAGEP